MLGILSTLARILSALSVFLFTQFKCTPSCIEWTYQIDSWMLNSWLACLRYSVTVFWSGQEYISSPVQCLSSSVKKWLQMTVAIWINVEVLKKFQSAFMIPAHRYPVECLAVVEQHKPGPCSSSLLSHQCHLSAPPSLVYVLKCLSFSPLRYIHRSTHGPYFSLTV